MKLRLSRVGEGHLILIGGTSGRWAETEHIDRAAIALARHDRPIAFVPAADCPPDYATSFLDAYTRLGAPDGYEVPIRSRAAAHGERNVELLARAGLIYFGGGETMELLASMTDTPALAAIASAYESGAVVAGMSAGAIALSAWGVSQGAGVLQGWAWLPGVTVAVHHTPDRDPLLAEALRDHPETAGIALPEDTAIGVAPDGEVREWGDGIRFVPGAQYNPA